MKNKLFYGDNLEVLRKYIKDETIDLCYIDPPFNSNRTYNQIYNNIGKEDRAQAQAFVDTWTWDDVAEMGYEQITTNFNGLYTRQCIELIIGLGKVVGKGSLFAYIIHITLRIVEIHRVLKPTGSFYLHCDPTASHYLKLVLDAIFCAGKGEFLNEFIWCYGERGISKSNYNKKHDVIFFYSKTENYTFNYKEVAQAYADSTVKKFKHTDPITKKKFRLRGRNVPEAGALRRQTDVPLYLESEFTYRQYLEDSDGVLAYDWVEMDFLNQAAAERLGYDTQKPESLLEIFIIASSKAGDTILDAYCGCGTTVAVSQRFKRNWIGIDITYHSISLILKRMLDTFGTKAINSIELHGIPKDFKAAEALVNKKEDKTRKEFEKWAVLTYSENRAIINEKKGGDGGADGIAFILDYDEKNLQENKSVIFSVKSDKKVPVSKIRELNGTMEHEGAVMGVMLVLYPHPNLVKASKMYGTYHSKMFDKSYPKIRVVTVEEMINGEQFEIPLSQKVDVVKNAKQKDNTKQIGLDL